MGTLLWVSDGKKDLNVGKHPNVVTTIGHFSHLCDALKRTALELISSVQIAYQRWTRRQKKRWLLFLRALLDLLPSKSGHLMGARAKEGVFLIGP